MKISKNNFIFVIFFFVLGTGIVFFNKNYKFVNEKEEHEIFTGEENNQSLQSGNINQIMSDGKLTIVPDKCIGCGACILEAPNNFRMNFDSRRAEVTSNNNLDGAEVRAAVKSCPTRAINL